MMSLTQFGNLFQQVEIRLWVFYTFQGQSHVLGVGMEYDLVRPTLQNIQRLYRCCQFRTDIRCLRQLAM